MELHFFNPIITVNHLNSFPYNHIVSNFKAKNGEQKSEWTLEKDREIKWHPMRAHFAGTDEEWKKVVETDWSFWAKEEHSDFLECNVSDTLPTSVQIIIRIKGAHCSPRSTGGPRKSSRDHARVHVLHFNLTTSASYLCMCIPEDFLNTAMENPSFVLHILLTTIRFPCHILWFPYSQTRHSTECIKLHSYL